MRQFTIQFFTVYLSRGNDKNADRRDHEEIEGGRADNRVGTQVAGFKTARDHLFTVLLLRFLS